MKRSSLYLGLAIFILLITAFFTFRFCSHRKLTIDPGFSEYISAFTSGRISVQSTIRIELAKEMGSVSINSEIDKKLFSFSPSVSGSARWIDNKTIEFRPEKPLKTGTQYQATFYLKKLLNVPSKFGEFVFDFETIKQSLSIEVESYQPNKLTNLSINNVTGKILTADVADEVSVEKVIEATQNNKRLPISWTHSGETKTHQFRIDSVQRTENAGEIKIHWEGSVIGADKSGDEIVKIPSINDFSALDVKMVQEPDQYLSIRFSDPLDPNQDLTGLIRFDNTSDLTFEIDRMFIKVYSSSKQTGSITLSIEKGIKNVAGSKLKEGQTFQVVFENIKPAIRLLGKGVILPDSKGLIFPFEGVNIKAVDVSIVKIFENNVSQFLQVNQLDGEYELKRAGRLVLKKTIRLDADKPLIYNKWNTFSIDLAGLIKQEPGAIYRVILSFKKEYSAYACGELKNQSEKENMTSIQEADQKVLENEISFWDTPSYNSYEGDYEEYGEDYNWEKREDPCDPSYFYGNKCQVSRNVLASNLGIIVKSSGNNKLLVAIANLVTTKPLSGVEIEIFNYQHQKIGNATTDGDGFCTIALSSKPFLLIAKDGTQRGYLRIDDGTSLSLSNFDVSGEVVQKGLKGFIYGERGVWRPGDTVYLSFILEDKLKMLPANHPVVLEIFNPQGQLYKKLIKTTGENGFYLFSFNTNASDVTGNWMAYIKIGGTTFSKTLKIETIKPNRLKILFDAGTNILKSSSQKMKLSAKWLHGAPAKSMRAKIDVSLSSAPTNFKGLDGYRFDDPVKKFESDEQTIFDNNLSSEGEAFFTAGLSAGHNAPGFLRANFITRVFEPGGEFSIDRMNMVYSPYNSYVGIKSPEDQYGYLFTDTTQIFDIATVTPEGKPVNRSKLEFKIYKLEWRWWWDSNSNDLANFANNTYASPAFSKVVNTENGKVKVLFKLNYPNWGRYLVRINDPESGHSTGKLVYFDWPGWRGRADKGDSKGATMLSFSMDKKAYKVGEKATITVPSSIGGRILVSLETGSEVVNAFWVETSQKETKATFEISEKMSPNVYVHVSLVQPHAQLTNDLPIRLYGVLPVVVENPASHLNPVISMPDVMEPEKPVSIRVSEKNNKSMTYTLAIVDDGLLDLTRFKTPDPWTSFYGREALGVKTWDLYDYVMGSYGGKLEQLFAIGGDDNLKGGAGQKANRFKPVVKVMGPFTLKSGTNKHEIKLPQYVGSVRVMVIAGDGAAFGNAEKTVPVRMPLMILATLPRVVGPGEEVALPVSVFAMEKRIKNISVEIVPNEFFQVLDAKSKSIQVKEIGEYDQFFKLKVASKEGVGKIKVIARSGNDKSEYDIEINVRNPNSKMIQYVESIVEEGKSTSLSYNLIGMPGTNKATLEISSIPPIDLSRRMRYLLEYPYGCVEQTTSGAFPQLFLDKYIELDDVAKKRRETNIKAAIDRINSMVTSDGGIGYWPGASYANEWGTSYAGYFLLEAESKGYNLPSGFKNNWIKFQKREARNWNLPKSVTYEYDRYDAELTQAYRLYTLALAKEPEMGAMNRMREMNGLSVPSIWRLAAAYAIAGQSDVAKQLIQKSGSEINSTSKFTSTFGSLERDWAMMLETLTLLKDKTNAFPFVKKISDALSSNQWMSTQTTAYGLLAISKFLESEKTSQEIKCEYQVKGRPLIKVETRLPVSQLKLDVKTPGNEVLSLMNTGKGSLFVRVVTEGIPEIGPLTGFENNLKVLVSFKNSNGGNIDVTKLNQGTDFYAEITVKNSYLNGGLTNLALNQVFPSGWEIANSRMENDEANVSTNYTYQDIRDDRVLTFFDLAIGQTKTFKFKLNASYVGKFYLPGTVSEAMYEPGVNAFVPGKWVEVGKEE